MTNKDLKVLKAIELRKRLFEIATDIIKSTECDSPMPNACHRCRAKTVLLAGSSAFKVEAMKLRYQLRLDREAHEGDLGRDGRQEDRKDPEKPKKNGKN